MTRQVLLSAVQPTNRLTLGNYVGAMRHWVSLQKEYEGIFFAVDLHALTLPQDPAELRENTYRLMATFVASGLDPNACLLFVQSQVPEHTQLAWLLTCQSSVGELQRMTQFKDKSGPRGAHVPCGLFVYPTLMAADILLYHTHLVPVGADQKQHVELTRDLALRVNHACGRELFTVPRAWIPKVGARIMSLQDPLSKMSKSDPNPKATVYITDSDDQIAKKFKGAVTDSGTDIAYDETKPGVRNLIDIQATLLDATPEHVVARYAGKLYGHLKSDTADVVIAALRPLRESTTRLLADRAHLDTLMQRGAERASERARHTLNQVYDAFGLVRGM